MRVGDKPVECAIVLGLTMRAAPARNDASSALSAKIPCTGMHNAKLRKRFDERATGETMSATRTVTPTSDRQAAPTKHAALCPMELSQAQLDGKQRSQEDADRLTEDETNGHREQNG